MKLFARIAVLATTASFLNLADAGDAETILRSNAEDYAHDPTARDIEIGFDISGDRFFMVVEAQDTGAHPINFQRGIPDYPVIFTGR